ncbi:MAG: hypothetical protein M1829_002595 [Trizodia sp. TS-e1964]|nr:MAG: hypothetical protein M1829_002595 [Trizodia sp. TS-e1964]
MELELLANRSQETCFLQYFCDNSDEKRNNAAAVLRGLILQILLQRNLFHHILPSFAIQEKALFNSSSFEALWRIFQNMIFEPLLGTIICVLDGIDECDETSIELLLRGFAALLRSNRTPACHLKLILLSRDFPEVIPCILSGFPRIRLEPDAKTEINVDINHFVDVKIE